MAAFDLASLQAALNATPSISAPTVAGTVDRAPEGKGVGAGPYLALLGGEAADLGTTLAAMKSGRGTEGNQMLAHGGTAGLVAGKAGTALLLAYLMHRLAAEGHPTAGKALGYLAGGAYGGLAVHNSQVGK